MGGAHAIVWPELTIDDDALGTLQDELAAAALREGHGPEVVVAGSWHRQHGDHLRNSAPVLDATGNEHAHHWKSVLFIGAQVRQEMVEPGDEILVLACDRFLASVAICKDYCDLATEAPWPFLDVDLLLVPSMGGRSTMDGHVARAAQDVISHGLRVFVVQQGDHGSSPSFVLPAPRTPPKSCTGLEVDVEHLVTSIDAGR